MNLWFMHVSSWQELVIGLAIRVFIIMFILPVHEFAHGWAANKLGDPTAKMMGRLTLNPMAHIDWLGAGLLILLGFGWAKPVPVNPYNFKDRTHKKRGMALTALIGLFCGKKHKGKLVSGLAFRHFNDRYGKPYAFDWICADPAVVSEYTADPLCGYAFSVSAYRQMFGLLRQINSPEWEEKLPLSLPILICGGDGDPVGNYGKDLQTLYDRLSERDFSDLRLHIYEGARHELHNDLCREQVFAEWSDFISGVVEGVNAARTMNGGFTL